MSGENGTSSSSANLGRSVEHWHHRSGDVEPNPGPRFWRGGELLSADITAVTAAKYRRAFNKFDIFLVVTRAVCYLHVDSIQFVVDAATRHLEWICGSDEPFLVLQEP